MMETNESEQYVAFTLDAMHEGIQNNVSHEEICEPVDECVLQEEDITEVTVGEDHQEDITETQMAVEIITDNCEEDEEDEDSAVIFIKKEGSPQFTSGDDLMAVEALRQLGGMYPCFEDKKVACATCNNTFAANEIAKHQAGCRSYKHSCYTCGEKFERKIDLNNHMVCHQVDRPHACRTCGNLFRSKANLQVHMAEKHQIERPHKCTVCGADFQRPSSLSNHMKIHSYVAGRAIMQPQPGPVISDVKSIKDVSESQDGSVLATVQTLQNFEIPQVQWAVQIATDQGNIDGLASQSDKIDTLQEFTVLPNGEVAQFTEYTTPNAVENTSFINDKRTYIEIDLQENKKYTCSQCGVSFARAASLTQHEKVHAKISPVECEYCDKQFQDAHFLATHQTSCTKKLMKSSESNASNAKWGKHACSECGKKFTTKQKMFRHQWIHRKKTHSCEVCGTQFEKQSELDEHRLSAHPGDSPFTCQECGKSFVSRQGLWEHGRTHAGSPAYFHCDTCSKTFSSRQGYLIHHRTHTGERPYGCKYCWKSFRDGGTLRKHERIHTGERPHVCPLCKRAFNQKVVLREHVRWVHAAGKNETEITGPPFPCPICDTLTQDRDELCAHIVKHSDQMIAQTKAKTVNSSVKVKPPQKRKGKPTEAKVKAAKSKAPAEGRIITAEEQNEALLSITEQLDPTAEPQDTYLIVKNEYNDAMCIKAYAKLSDVTQADGSGSINVIAFAKPDDKEQEEADIVDNDESNTVHLIPFNTASGETVFISTDKQNNTLHLISKQNENSPVLAIPNPESDDNFPNDIAQIHDSETHLEMSVRDSPIPEEECSEDIPSDSLLVEHASIKDEYSENTANESDDSEDECEELVCGICGSDFDDKNILMEHVKIHI